MSVWWRAIEVEGGDAYGFRYHSKRQREALGRLGVEFSDDAEVAVTVITPSFFEPVPGRFNVLNTAWEASKLSPAQIERVNRADLVIVNSTWLVDVFRDAVRPDLPVEYVPLGVDPDFRPRLRSVPEGPFRWLWVGAPNARKGWEIVVNSWAPYAERAGVELYIKTSVIENERCERVGNVIFDSRRLPRAELIDLYHQAHGFVFPSIGEGFGLTLAEAIATGLPAVYTHFGGVTDFAVGRHLRCDMVKIPATSLDGNFGVDVEVPVADPNDVALGMLEVMSNYDRVRRDAYQAGKRLARKWTWDRASRMLLDVLREHAGVEPARRAA